MNKILIIIIIFLLFNNCSIKSINKEQRFWSKKKLNIQEVKIPKKILIKEIRKEKELNPSLEIKFSSKETNKKSKNTQNDIGELSYDGILEKKRKYKFSKFNNFESIEVKPVFYDKNIIFFNNKGTITLYDER